MDRGSAVNFGADSGLCLSPCLILGHKQNLDHRFFFSLGHYVNDFIQIISFFEKSSFKFRCETVIGIVLCYSHQACHFCNYLCEITRVLTIYKNHPVGNFRRKHKTIKCEVSGVGISIKYIHIS